MESRYVELLHPHSQFFFWRTAAGAEIDLVIERGAERFAIEIKVARGDKPQAIRALESAAADVGVKRAYLIDQGTDHDPLRPNLERRGFSGAVGWLPA